jgi:hypothetical protein
MLTGHQCIFKENLASLDILKTTYFILFSLIKTMNFGLQRKNTHNTSSSTTANKSIGKSWADGSCVSAVAASLFSCSGRTSNFRLIANHQLLFLFHHRLAGLDGSLFPSLRQYSVVGCNAYSSVRVYSAR